MYNFLYAGANTYGGGVNENVLVQEYAEGEEYAVDTVSMDGVVKAVAVWKYHKKPMNGAPFVYQCTQLVPCDGPMQEEIVQYCLDAVRTAGIKWGPTHTEVRMTAQGPKLIEINARWHSANFVQICRECIGFDAISATLDAYFDPKAFNSLPKKPSTLKKSGRIIHLISSVEGKLIGW